MSECEKIECRKCDKELCPEFVAKCFDKFKKHPTICADCFLDEVNIWAFSEDDDEDAHF